MRDDCGECIDCGWCQREDYQPEPMPEGFAPTEDKDKLYGCIHEDGHGYCNHPLTGKNMCCEDMSPTMFDAVVCQRAL